MDVLWYLLVCISTNGGPLRRQQQQQKSARYRSREQQQLQHPPLFLVFCAMEIDT